MENQNRENQTTNKIDIGNIYSAGIAIKGAAYALLLFLITNFIGVLFILKMENLINIKNTLIIIGIFNLIIVIVIVVKLYDAGKNLQDSV